MSDELDQKKQEAADGTSQPRQSRMSSFAHAEVAMAGGEREPYGPPGFRGLLTNPYVTFLAAFTAVGEMIFGYDQGVVSIILVMPQFLDYFPRVATAGAGFWKGLLTAMIELGAFLGALSCGYIADRFSRKYTIMTAMAVFIVGSVLQTASVGYGMLVIARLIGGIGIGMLSMVSPLYTAEIAPPEIRGALLVIEEFCIVTGIVIAYWITYGTRFISSDWSWRLPFLLQMTPALILGIGIYFLPFTPRWLESKGRKKEALETLCKVRRLPPDDHRIRLEYVDIQAEVTFHKEVAKQRHPNAYEKSALRLELASWTDTFRRGCWRRTHVGMMLMFFQQFVGINALIYYSPTLFQTMGLDYDMQLVLSGILNVTQLVGVATSLYTMDAFGRRPLLLVGSTCMTISHIIIAVLVGKYNKSWPQHRGAGWASVAFLFFYMLSFGASWGPVPWAIPSEIFPSTLRAKGVALSTCSNWFNNFVIGLITPPLVQNTGYGAYTFFAVFCLLSFVWTWFFVPETKGRTLEAMDHVFGDSTTEEENRRRSLIEGDILTKEEERSAKV